MAKFRNSMKALFILSTSDFANVEIFYKDSNNAVVPIDDSSFKSIADNIKQHRSKVILLLYGCDVTSRKIFYPKNIRKSKLKKIVPNMLEEEIIGEIGSLSYYIGQSEKKGQEQVCLINKSLLQDLTDILDSNNIYPEVMTSLSSIIPFKDNAWSILKYNEYYIINTQTRVNIITNQKNFDTLINLMLNEEPVNDMFFYTNNEEPLILSNTNINIHKAKVDIAKWVAEFDITHPKVINLQKENKSQEKLFANRKVQRHLYIIMAMFVVMTLGFLIKSNVDLKFEINLQKTQLEKQYFELYPDATSVISPKLRVQRELKASSLQNIESFFNELTTISRVINVNSDLEVLTLHFHDEQFKIKLQSENIASIERLLKNLKNKNFSVVLSSSNKTGTKIISRIVVKRQ